MPCKTATVYTLSDPRTEKVRYVGCTSSSLDSRLKGHISESMPGRMPKNPKRDWIQELFMLGLEPIITPVDEVPVEDARQAEEDMIERHVVYKSDLLNSRPKRILGQRIEWTEEAKASHRSATRFFAVVKAMRRYGIDPACELLLKVQKEGHEMFSCPTRQIQKTVKKFCSDFALIQ